MGEQVAAGLKEREAGRLLYKRIKEKEKKQRGRSSVGRAPALQAGGQEFESLRLHCDYKTVITSCTLKTSYRKR